MKISHSFNYDAHRFNNAHYLINWKVVDYQINIRDFLELNVNSKFRSKIAILIQNKGCKTN